MERSHFEILEDMLQAVLTRLINLEKGLLYIETCVSPDRQEKHTEQAMSYQEQIDVLSKRIYQLEPDPFLPDMSDMLKDMDSCMKRIEALESKIVDNYIIAQDTAKDLNRRIEALEEIIAENVRILPIDK